MKFKSIYKNAKRLDDTIDNYLSATRAAFVPIRETEKMVYLLFPDATRTDFGLHKLVFRLQHKSHRLALKVGRQADIEKDHKAYKQLPSELRHVYFARVFWHTKYCLLQEYGVKAEVTEEELVQLRSIAGRFGLLDITCDNVRNVDGNLKIIDAGVAPDGLFRLWKAADFITLRLPTPIRQIIRKSRLLILKKEK